MDIARKESPVRSSNLVTYKSGGTVSTVDAVERHTGLRLRFSPDRQFKRIQGARADRLALQWMYSGATLALPRKMERYQNVLGILVIQQTPICRQRCGRVPACSRVTSLAG